MGGSHGLPVMGGESFDKWRGFESPQQMLDRYFFHINFLYKSYRLFLKNDN